MLAKSTTDMSTRRLAMKLRDMLKRLEKLVFGPLKRKRRERTAAIRRIEERLASIEHQLSVVQGSSVQASLSRIEALVEDLRITSYLEAQE
jgi:uncharacterized membrane-anchored protein